MISDLSDLTGIGKTSSLSSKTGTGESARLSGSTAASGTTNLLARLGQKTEALVLTVQAVDERLKQRLLQLSQPPQEMSPRPDATGKRAATTAAPLTQDGSNTSSNSTSSLKLPTQQSPTLATLLQQTKLQLAELIIGREKLLVVTDQPITAGMRVRTEVSPQGLQILAPATPPAAPASEQKPANRQTPQVPSPSAIPNVNINGAKNAGGATAPPNQSTTNALLKQAGVAPIPPTLTTSARPLNTSFAPTQALPSDTATRHLDTLQQALRKELPHVNMQEPAVTKLLQAARLLNAQLAQPDNRALQRELPPQLPEVLNNLLTHLRSPRQLAQPMLIKQTLNTSGQQLEERLASALNLRPKTPEGGNKTQAQETPESLATLSQRDLKAAILQLVAILEGSSTPRSAGDKAQSGDQLLSLLKNLMGGHSGASTADSPSLKTLANAEQIQEQLLDLSRQALTKTLVQQLQSLQTSHGLSDTNNVQHWQLEIPVRHGNDLQHIDMQLEEKWVTDFEDEDKRREARRIRQWQVKLSFDLPDAGAFHAHLLITENQVSATLWAEQNDTYKLSCERIQQLRQRLEDDGVTVKDVECLPGRPRDERLSLNYSLVDITT